MIEAGVAGGSAAHHAEQRRNVATRLVAEAQWLDSVADDERATAARLNELSTANAILHDLKLEGQQGNIDHLVVGPGGAFAVLTRRFTEPVVNRSGMLFAGERSLQPEIEAAKATAARLGDLLRVAVVPMIGFHGGILSTAAPQQVDGVYTCAVENLARVIVRAAHTQLAPHKITEVTERALTLVFNAGSVPRTQTTPEAATATPVEPSPTITPWIPAAAVPAAAAAAAAAAATAVTPAAGDDAAIQQEAMSILRLASTTAAPAAAGAAAGVASGVAAGAAAPVVAAPAAVPPVQPSSSLFQPIQAAQPAQPLQPFHPATVDARAAMLSDGGMAPTSLNELSQMAASAGQGLDPDGSAKGRSKAKVKEPKAPKAAADSAKPRSRGFTITLVLILCIVAATVGAAVAIMQNGDDDGAAETPGTTASATSLVTVTTGVTATTVAGPMAAAVAAPLVSFSPVCPAPGSGWSWVADWPGDLAGLAQYDVEYQNPDGTWTAVAPLTSSAVASMSVAGQPPGSTLVFRITAVMQDSSRSVNQAVSFTTPASPC